MIILATHHTATVNRTFFGQQASIFPMYGQNSYPHYYYFTNSILLVLQKEVKRWQQLFADNVFFPKVVTEAIQQKGENPYFVEFTFKIGFF